MKDFREETWEKKDGKWISPYPISKRKAKKHFKKTLRKKWYIKDMEY